MSKNENYDISTNDIEIKKETELIEINPKNLTGKDSGYTPLSESEISTSSELLETNNGKQNVKNNEIFFKDKIKYRKGNLFTFFYNSNGIPRIAIGPDCKFIY